MGLMTGRRNKGQNSAGARAASRPEDLLRLYAAILRDLGSVQKTLSRVLEAPLPEVSPAVAQAGLPAAAARPAGAVEYLALRQMEKDIGSLLASVDDLAESGLISRSSIQQERLRAFSRKSRSRLSNSSAQ